MKVLIADDDPLWRKVLEENVRSWGYEVVTADNGKQAWRLRRWQLYRKPRVLPQLKVWMREYDRLQHHSVEITWPVRRQLKTWREAGDLAD